MSPRRSEPRGDLRRALYAGPHALVGSPITRALVWINVAVFVAEVALSRTRESLVDVPTRVVLWMGANVSTLTLHAGHWDTLLTSCFLHGSVLHIVFNMYALRQVGPLVERPVGSARYSVMYVLSGIAASLTSALWADWRGGPAYPSVGASGAICGVMGAAVVTWIRVEGWRSAIAWQIGFWLFVTLGVGAVTPNVDNAAHAGGFAAGCLIASTWRRGVPDTMTKRIVLVGASALACLAAASTTAWRDMTDPYAFESPEQRATEVSRALARGDCDAARRALAAVEALPPSDADLNGLRAAFSEVCSRRNSSR